VVPPDPPHQHPILRTKLYRPPVTEDLVCRSQLHNRMDLGLQTPMTVVSAPAGYGKSVLVRHWAETVDDRCAWLSLDNDDSDLKVFVSYFLAAIGTILPDACPGTSSMITAPKLPPIPVLGACLVNDLHDIERRFVLALDDYHRVASSSEVHDLLGFLMTYPPEALRLVIITRRDPPLPLAKMRASRQLTEVRLEDLRFSRADCAAFLDKSIGLSISSEALANLLQQTEGWAAGLRLVTLNLHHLDDPEIFLRELRGGVQHGRDYLVQDVLAHQSPRMREWLLRASVLDRFCPDLCDALCADDETGGGPKIDGRFFVEELQRCNLFTLSLDADGEWFRYHHLFQEVLQDLLQREKSTEEVAALHARASTWLAERGFIDEALRHALDGGDVRSAMRLVEQHRYELLNTEQWSRLERWLGHLPHDAVVENPVLLSAMSYILDYKGSSAESWSYCDQAETLLSTLSPESANRKAVDGETATLSALRAFFSGDGHRALELAERALALLPPQAMQIRAFAVGWRALALQTIGNLAEALAAIDETLAVPFSGSALPQVRAHLYCCLIHMMAGSLDELEWQAQRAIEVTRGCSLSGSIGEARYLLGVSHYLRNELPEAERELLRMLEDRYSVRTSVVVHGAAALACVYLVQDRTAEASRIVEVAITQTAESGHSIANGTGRAFEVDLAVRQGRVAEARRLSTGIEFELVPPIYYFYVPQLTPVKLLLAEKTTASLAKAGEKLDELEEFLRRTHRMNTLIDVLALQALVLDASGNEPAALDKLGEAMALAKPGGNIRSFVDLGAPMADLLRRAMRNSTERGFCHRLLEAFGRERTRAAAGDPPAAGAGERSSRAPYDLDPLTNRELDILELLSQRLQNKEIAARLGISKQTVGTHLKRIYQKLGVHGRRQAIERAIESGILDRRPPG